MSDLKRVIPLLLFIFFAQGAASNLIAQSSVNTSGGDAMTNSGKVSFSVGQVFYTTHKTDSHKKALGVQQAAEIFLNVGIEEDLLNFQASAYPNPTIRDVILSVPEFFGQELSYVISDMTGKILAKDSINSAETSISFSQFPRGVYFLNISLRGHIAKTFNIIKNN